MSTIGEMIQNAVTLGQIYPMCNIKQVVEKALLDCPVLKTKLGSTYTIVNRDATAATANKFPCLTYSMIKNSKNMFVEITYYENGNEVTETFRFNGNVDQFPQLQINATSSKLVQYTVDSYLNVTDTSPLAYSSSSLVLLDDISVVHNTKKITITLQNCAFDPEQFANVSSTNFGVAKTVTQSQAIFQTAYNTEHNYSFNITFNDNHNIVHHIRNHKYTITSTYMDYTTLKMKTVETTLTRDDSMLGIKTPVQFSINIPNVISDVTIRISAELFVRHVVNFATNKHVTITCDSTVIVSPSNGQGRYTMPWENRFFGIFNATVDSDYDLESSYYVQTNENTYSESDYKPFTNLLSNIHKYKRNLVIIKTKKSFVSQQIRFITKNNLGVKVESTTGSTTVITASPGDFTENKGSQGTYNTTEEDGNLTVTVSNLPLKINDKGCTKWRVFYGGTNIKLFNLSDTSTTGSFTLPNSAFQSHSLDVSIECIISESIDITLICKNDKKDEISVYETIIPNQSTKLSWGKTYQTKTIDGTNTAFKYTFKKENSSKYTYLKCTLTLNDFEVEGYPKILPENGKDWEDGEDLVLSQTGLTGSAYTLYVKGEMYFKQKTSDTTYLKFTNTEVFVVGEVSLTPSDKCAIKSGPTIPGSPDPFSIENTEYTDTITVDIDCTNHISFGSARGRFVVGSTYYNYTDLIKKDSDSKKITLPLNTSVLGDDYYGITSFGIEIEMSDIQLHSVVVVSDGLYNIKYHNIRTDEDVDLYTETTSGTATYTTDPEDAEKFIFKFQPHNTDQVKELVINYYNDISSSTPVWDDKHFVISSDNTTVVINSEKDIKPDLPSGQSLWASDNNAKMVIGTVANVHTIYLSTNYSVSDSCNVFCWFRGNSAISQIGVNSSETAIGQLHYRIHTTPNNSWNFMGFDAKPANEVFDSVRVTVYGYLLGQDPLIDTGTQLAQVEATKDKYIFWNYDQLVENTDKTFDFSESTVHTEPTAGYAYYRIHFYPLNTLASEFRIMGLYNTDGTIISPTPPTIDEAQITSNTTMPTDVTVGFYIVVRWIVHGIPTAPPESALTIQNVAPSEFEDQETYGSVDSWDDITDFYEIYSPTPVAINVREDTESENNTVQCWAIRLMCKKQLAEYTYHPTGYTPSTLSYPDRYSAKSVLKFKNMFKFTLPDGNEMTSDGEDGLNHGFLPGLKEVWTVRFFKSNESEYYNYTMNIESDTIIDPRYLYIKYQDEDGNPPDTVPSTSVFETSSSYLSIVDVSTFNNEIIIDPLLYSNINNSNNMSYGVAPTLTGSGLKIKYRATTSTLPASSEPYTISTTLRHIDLLFNIQVSVPTTTSVTRYLNIQFGQHDDYGSARKSGIIFFNSEPSSKTQSYNEYVTRPYYDYSKGASVAITKTVTGSTKPVYTWNITVYNDLGQEVATQSSVLWSDNIYAAVLIETTGSAHYDPVTGNTVYPLVLSWKTLGYSKMPRMIGYDGPLLTDSPTYDDRGAFNPSK